MLPEVNIGLVGHVDHGKTTLTQRFSGKWADTHSEELKRGITIRLGYADATIRKIPGKKGPDQWTVEEEVDGKKTKVERVISLVDAPGHESLMATMIAGASLMDGALLLVAANERCPQPQTVEHLMALEMAGIEKIIVVQNKIDAVSVERAQENYQQIKEVLQGTRYAEAPIVPVSALHDVNIDALIGAMQEHFPTPKRDLKADPIFYVARSFDINKPGSDPRKLKGGVLGGAMIQGKLEPGDDLEIRPGRLVEEANQRIAKPLKTTCEGFMAGGETQKHLQPGGSASILTKLDPALVKSDSLTGSVVGTPGKLPPIWYSVELQTHLLERAAGGEEDIEGLKQNEMLLLNVHSAATVGVVTHLGKDRATLSLRAPICAKKGDRMTISRRVGARFRLIGYGLIDGGESQD